MRASVVVANENSPADVAAAVPLAEQAHAPLLLSSPLAVGTASTASYRGGAAGTGPARLTASLGTARRAAGDQRSAPAQRARGRADHRRASAEMPGAQVTTDPAGLAGDVPAQAAEPGDRPGAPGKLGLALAATATAKAAGATVVPVPATTRGATRPRLPPISAVKPRQVIAAGSGFGPASRLVSRLAVARTGVQLPGGGQLIVPMHRLVALYGQPGVPALGALGQQGIRPASPGPSSWPRLPGAERDARRAGVRDHRQRRHSAPAGRRELFVPRPRSPRCAPGCRRRPRPGCT